MNLNFNPDIYISHYSHDYDNFQMGMHKYILKF